MGCIVIATAIREAFRFEDSFETQTQVKLSRADQTCVLLLQTLLNYVPKVASRMMSELRPRCPPSVRNLNMQGVVEFTGNHKESIWNPANMAYILRQLEQFPAQPESLDVPFQCVLLRCGAVLSIARLLPLTFEVVPLYLLSLFLDRHLDTKDFLPAGLKKPWGLPDVRVFPGSLLALSNFSGVAAVEEYNDLLATQTRSTTVL